MKKYNISILKVTGIMDIEVEAENQTEARQKAAKINEENPMYKETELYIVSLEEKEDEENGIKQHTEG